MFPAGGRSRLILNLIDSEEYVIRAYAWDYYAEQFNKILQVWKYSIFKFYNHNNNTIIISRLDHFI